MKKFIFVVVLTFALAISGKAFAAQSIALTGTLPAVQKGAGATAAIPAQSIALTGTLPAGVQGLTASDGNNGVGVAVLEGLGYLFTVKLLTLHF